MENKNKTKLNLILNNWLRPVGNYRYRLFYDLSSAPNLV